MRAVIPGLLWIGNARDARDPGQLMSAGIKAVVDLAMDEPVSMLPRDLVYCRLPLVDGDDDEALQILHLAVTTLRDSIRLGIPTLVACSAGLSRSPAVAAMAVALWQGRPVIEVLREITAQAPHDVAPALWVRLTSLPFES
jgi:protein-tyrosine phosphatase